MARWCPEKQNFALYPDCGECGDRICDAFFCLVVGSRGFSDYALLSDKLDRLLVNQNRVVIVSGGASGADTLAIRYAGERGYRCIVFSAEWETYGKKAGYIRNRAMQEYISKVSDRGCVAFWDGKSPGTRQNFALAKQFGNKLKIVLV